MKNTKKNRNLGNYDMVLSLSISKINFMFKKMYQRKIIHSDWAFLTNSMGKQVKALTNEEAKSYWQNIDTNKSNLAAKKAEFESIDKDMTAAIRAKSWGKVEELDAKKESVQAEVKALKAKVDEANLYDLGLIATIAEPKIELRSQNYRELIFQISFKPGSTLFYTHEGKKAEYDLGGNGIKYAFRVSIGKIKITSDKKIVEIDENGKEQEKTLRDKGINDNDFTIQALFLDFENANITDYDSGSSFIPKELSNNGILQAAMVNYFKNLANSDNPYVLGYGIQKNEVTEGERGFFYPTGVAYSTSPSTEQRASTFNFLMLLNNHRFPKENDSGVLPSSMMEQAQDKTATVSGVFGLNMSEFEDCYVPLLSQLLHTKIKSNMEEKSRYKSSKVNNKNIEVSFGWHDVSGTMDLEYQGIQANRTNKGVDIRYAIKAKADVHQEIKEIIGTLGVDWDLSTSGQARLQYAKKPTPHGCEGTLLVTLNAGASGKLDLNLNYSEKFKLGFNSSEPHYKDGDWGRFWDKLNKVVSIFLEVLFKIETDIGKDLDDLGSIEDVGNALNIQRLENLENKVILPVASVYTYKNVRLLGENSSDPDAVLLFDTSYAPVAR